MVYFVILCTISDMRNYRTIRVSEDTYQELLDYRAQLEIANRSRISFDQAIDLMFTEIHGLECPSSGFLEPLAA